MKPSKEIQEYLQETSNRLQKLQEDIMRIDSKIASLQQKRNELISQMDDIIAFFNRSTKKSSEEIMNKLLPGTPPSMLRSNMRIGDAIETIIKTEGAQFQKDIIERIKNAGIRLSEKAPYVVIGNTIRGDKQKRFKVLKDGRVALRKENEKADAKS